MDAKKFAPVHAGLHCHIGTLSLAGELVFLLPVILTLSQFAVIEIL